MNTLDSLFDWFAVSTVRGAVLVLAVLALQAALRRVLSAQWRYALWLPVLLVLIAPHLPQSRWSVENYLTSTVVKWSHGSAGGGGEARNTLPAPALSPVAGTEMLPAAAVESSSEASEAAPPAISSWRRMAAVFWAAGAAGIMIFSAIAYWRTLRQIVCSAVAPDPETELMLAQMALACGLRRVPRLILSAAVPSPAVTGLLRPTLLLPARFPSGLTREEANLVLLHELMHLRRWDLPLNWLLCLVQAVHWCNPVLWLAFRRMRVDRETACDAQVLGLAAGDCRAEYGHALLKLEGSVAPPGLSLGFVGIFERAAGMRSRIRAIAAYRRAHRAWGALAAVLIGGLILSGATRAQTPGGTEKQQRSFRSESAATEPSRRALVQRKLQSIVIPRLEFREASLQEAIAIVQAKSVALDTAEPDPARRGVKITFKLNAPRSSKPDAAPLRANPNDARMTVSLRDIPLAEALNYISGLANVAFRVTDVGVEVTERPLVTMQRRVPPALGLKSSSDVRRFLLENGVPFPEGASASISPDSTWLTVRNTQDNLDRVNDLLYLPQEQPRGADVAAIRQKLETIIIPQLEFRDATIREAVEFLKRRSSELDTAEPDPTRRGVNFVLKLDSSGAPAPALSNIPRIPGLEPESAAGSAPVPPILSSHDARLTLSLKNIPLLEVIRYVTSVANLDYKVEPHAVAIVPRSTSTDQLRTKEWKLNAVTADALELNSKPPARQRLLERGVSFPPGSSAIWSALSHRLVVRNTRANIEKIEEIISNGGSGAVEAQLPTGGATKERAESIVIPHITFREATLREAVDFLKSRSVALDPDGKGVNLILDVSGAKAAQKISLELTNPSLWDALRYVARLADLELTADAHALRIQSPAGESAQP